MAGCLPKNCRNTLKKVNDCSFYIDGRMIDLVQSFSHLGHLITSDSDDGEDFTIRKHSFIGQVNINIHYVILANYPLSLNKFYFMHTVLVIIDVSYGRYQIVTLKSFVLLGRRACDACGVFHFRFTVFCYHFCLNAFSSETKYIGVLLILFGHVFDTNLLLFNLLLCMDCSRPLFGQKVVYCAELFR